MAEVTEILGLVEHGDPKAAEELLPLVYEELRKLAAVRMANEKPGHTLQPTALVHEAWLKVAGQGNQHFANRGHFFKAAAGAMQQILVDAARRKHGALIFIPPMVNLIRPRFAVAAIDELRETSGSA